MTLAKTGQRVAPQITAEAVRNQQVVREAYLGRRLRRLALRWLAVTELRQPKGLAEAEGRASSAEAGAGRQAHRMADRAAEAAETRQCSAASASAA